jgi:hypothetical protein
MDRHLNCIAEWLSANSSCPECRGDLPSLPRRMRPREVRQRVTVPVGGGEGFAAIDDGDDMDTEEEYDTHNSVDSF